MVPSLLVHIRLAMCLVSLRPDVVGVGANRYPQCLHTSAFAEISSAQSGQVLTMDPGWNAAL